MIRPEPLFQWLYTWVRGSNEKQFRGGLVFKARRLFVSLYSRPGVIKQNKKS